MATYLNADIPPIYCKVRKEYLYDLKQHKGESLECVIFGINGRGKPIGVVPWNQKSTSLKEYVSGGRRDH